MGTADYIAMATKAAKTLRELADAAAQSMGQRQPDLDAHADVAEVAAYLASRQIPQF